MTPKLLMPWALPLAMLVFAGCAGTATFEYPSQPNRLARVSEKPIASALAIEKVIDTRPEAFEYNTIALYFIPLWPYGDLTDSMPELNAACLSIASYDFLPERDLTAAATTSLKHSNLFGEILPANGTRDALVFRATVLDTTYEGTVYSYGLSFAGSVLWIIGLPAATAENHLKIKFEIFRGNEATPRWSNEFNGSESTTIGLYYHYGNDVKGYPMLMEQAMNAALIDLYRQATLNPKLLE